MKFNFASIIILSLTLSSIFTDCDKEEEKLTGTLKINFVGTANNQPFVLGNSYTSVDGLKCKYENFKFYISNLRTYQQGVADTLVEAALINFSNDNPNKSVSIELPNGSYGGLGFGIGLDSLQNTYDPTQYGSSSPFSSVNGMYWGMAFMYRFLIIEGAIDTTSDGVDNYVQPITIHTGKSDLYKPINFTNFPFTIERGKTTNINVNFDVNKMFYTSSDTINLKVNGITHTSDNYPLAAKVIKNFANSLNVSQ